MRPHIAHAWRPPAEDQPQPLWRLQRVTPQRPPPPAHAAFVRRRMHLASPRTRFHSHIEHAWGEIESTTEVHVQAASIKAASPPPPKGGEQANRKQAKDDQAATNRKKSPHINLTQATASHKLLINQVTKRNKWRVSKSSDDASERRSTRRISRSRVNGVHDRKIGC